MAFIRLNCGNDFGGGLKVALDLFCKVSNS